MSILYKTFIKYILDLTSGFNVCARRHDFELLGMGGITEVTPDVGICRIGPSLYWYLFGCYNNFDFD